MARTQGRALVTGNITLQAAKLFAALLGLFGALVLALFTNPLALSIALLGLFVYLALYSTLKYRSVHATLVGSIAGATPPVVGYCALANQLDMKALWLFAILVLWQMPHFYAIALYRLKEYSAAQIPVLPVVKGLRATKIQMALYILAFVGACPALALLQPVGLIYFFVTLPLGILWLLACKRSLLTGGTGASLWGRQMFLLSLGVIVSLCVGIYISVSFWSGTAIG